MMMMMMMSPLLLLLVVALLLPLATAPPVLVSKEYEANVEHLPAILECLKDGTKRIEERVNAIKELQKLSSWYEFQRLADAGGMEILAQLIDSSDKALRADAIFILNKMVAESPALRDQLISIIKISRFEQLMLERNDLSRDERTMLSKIIELVMPKIGESMGCSALKDNNYANMLKKAILNDSDVILRENLHWLIKKSGHLANLVKCLKNEEESIVDRDQAAAALFNISSLLSELDEDVIKAGVLNVLEQINSLEEEDRDTAKLKSHASGIVGNLAQRRLPTVLECLKNGTKSSEVRKKAAAEELKVLSAFNTLHISLIHAGGVEILDKLLDSSDIALRTDAIFILNNIYLYAADNVKYLLISKIPISHLKQLLERNDLSGSERTMLKQFIAYYKTK